MALAPFTTDGGTPGQRKTEATQIGSGTRRAANLMVWLRFRSKKKKREKKSPTPGPRQWTLVTDRQLSINHQASKQALLLFHVHDPSIPLIHSYCTGFSTLSQPASEMISSPADHHRSTVATIGRTTRNNTTQQEQEKPIPLRRYQKV